MKYFQMLMEKKKNNDYFKNSSELLYQLKLLYFFFFRFRLVHLLRNDLYAYAGTLLLIEQK